jgi:hypothetical protein
MDSEWRRNWEQALKETEVEKPELIAEGLKMRAAAEEPTLSGSLRRAVHKSSLSLPEIIERLETSPDEFSDFLTGDHSLPSDALDRLAAILGYELVPVGTEAESQR